MLLYHYSKERYSSLKTKRLTQKFTTGELRRIEQRSKDREYVGQYIDHISFFFDPIPSKLVSGLFGKDHSVWVEGTVLYEYVINLKDVEGFLAYEVVESPLEVEILTALEWDYANPDFAKQYFKDRAVRSLANGETGFHITGLIGQYKKYSGKISDYITRAVRHPDFQENRLKYAAGVPHLMLYPNGGKVHYRGVNRIVIGKESRVAL